MADPNGQPRSRSAERIAADCLAVRIRLLNRTISAVYDDALRPLGITVGQLNILVVVARLGPVSPGLVARRLNMEKSTLSRNLDRLKEHGWLLVSIRRSGRGQALRLGRSGRRMLERAEPHWKQAQSRAEAILGQRGSKAIHRAADAVWSRAGRD